MHAISIEGLDVELRLARFTGSEGLSRHFRFEVTFVADAADLTRSKVLGSPATLTIDAGDHPRLVHGIVSRIEQGEDAGDSVAYRIDIVPTVHPLTLRKACRIFQEMKVPDIVAAVLDDAGIKASARELRLKGSYAPREYCVQYRESDWDFIARLLEEEGITYFFDHSGKADMLVFADASTSFAALDPGTVRYRPATDAMVGGEAVSILRIAEAMTSDAVTLRDYDFVRPDLLIEGQAKAEGSNGLEIYDAPAEVVDVPPTKALAKVRLEEKTIERRVGRGDASVPRFVPGATFELTEHALAGFNAQWLLVEVDHEGHDPAVFDVGGTPYSNHFRVVPAAAPYRPARVTPRPVVHGSHTALVVGPAGEEIHVDAHGRIKVHFHWDRIGKKDDKSSCWIRVSQGWAGPAFGIVFLPRVGHEVVVSFLEGDPDRPLVTGSVYNGKNVPPYALPANKTQSGIKTRSSPGGAGTNFNELRFEDKKGSEEVLLHAEKDHTIVVENDENKSVGHDQSLRVDHDRTHSVGVDEDITIGHDRTLTVAANETDVIGANYSGTVGGNATVAISGGLGVTIGGAFSQAVEKSATITIGEGKEESIGADAAESVGKDKTLTVGGSMSTDVEKDANTRVGKNSTTDVDGAYALTVGESYMLECGDAKVTVKKNGDVTIEGKKIIVKGSGPIELQGSKLTIKSDGGVDVKASGSVQIKGSAISAN